MAIRSIEQEQPRGPAEVLTGARILVVEDEILIAMEVTCVLEDQGALVIGPACTLEEALDLAGTQEISVAVLDMYLGRSSIAPVAESLKRRGVPFLFYSGQPASDPVRQAWMDTVILSKPARARELTDAVAALLEDNAA